LDERAEQLAGKIFNSLKDPECQRLDIERNLLPLFAGQRDDNGKRRLTPIETEESAAKDQHYASIHQAILLFFNKPRERSRISRDELVYHIKRSFREQARLMASLAGMSAAIDQVGNAMRGFLCFILLLVTMSIFGVNVFNALVSLSSAIVSLAFLFGASAKNAFDSAIFLFFIHVSCLCRR
jgi:small-conductance mechanosensitive channel